MPPYDSRRYEWSTCAYCGERFPHKNMLAKFCSDNCRVRHKYWEDPVKARLNRQLLRLKVETLKCSENN